MKRVAILVAFFSFIIVCSPAPADVIRLKDLIDNDLYIDSGDKRFDNFEYSFTGDMPSAANVNVITFVDQQGNFGLTFQGGFIDLYGNGASDALIRFRVTVLDPDRKISDAHLSGNPAVVGDGIVQVSETFLPDVPDKVLSIHHIAPGGSVQLCDAVYFREIYTTLNVQKDILAMATTPGSAATISMVDQTFSQVLVPEPSAIVLLSIGLSLFGCFVRRARR